MKTSNVAAYVKTKKDPKDDENFEISVRDSFVLLLR